MVRSVIALCKPKNLFLVAVLSLLLSVPVLVFGQNGEPAESDFDSIEALIEILQTKGVLTEEEAAKFINRYRKEPTLSQKKGEPVIMIIPEEQEEEIAGRVSEKVDKQVGKEVKALDQRLDYMSDDMLRRTSENRRNLKRLETKVTEDLATKVYQSSWAQRIRFGGDVRVRYQADLWDNQNAPTVLDESVKEITSSEFDNGLPRSKLKNTTDDRHRFRYRVRLAMKAKVIDPRKDIKNVGKVELGVRLASGNDENPISTNDTLGDYQNKDSIVLDRGYLKWTYQPWEPVWGGKIPEVSVTGGRIPNPWFYSDLLWDSDLNFEGIAFNHKTDTLTSNPWRGYVTLGAFSIQEEEKSQDDKWLYAGQVGFEYNKPMGLSGKFGIAYYDYKEIVGEINPIASEKNDFTAPEFRQGGNTLMDIDPSGGWRGALASDYNLINLTGKLDYSGWFPIHIQLLADYVKNVGFDQDEVERRAQTDVPKDTQGYQVGLTVGYPEIVSFGEWNAFLSYKYLEADAVLDAFTDSDFHEGGTNAQGWILGGELGLYENVWMSVKWISTDEISEDPLAVDTLQLDVNSRF